MEASLPAGLPAGLRGDYAQSGPDFALPQARKDYDPEEHARWRTLYQRQAALLPRHGAAAYAGCLARLPFAEGVPDFAEVSALLRRATGFTLVAVPGLIPDAAFFRHLAARRFPVTRWLRRAEEMDYIVEPDVFHDAFGHVPLLLDADFADFLEAYGRLGLLAQRRGALKPLARLYWFMVEFGLIREADGLRAYGAGIMSSRAELLRATEGPAPQRLRFDLSRVLRTDYRIDELQPTYFVIESFAELFAAAEATLPLLDAATSADPIPPGASAPGDLPC